MQPKIDDLVYTHGEVIPRHILGELMQANI